MEYRRLGNSDLVCSALGFGTWEMSTTDYGKINVKEASRSVHEAIDLGINLFDTAEAYGPYIAEKILGQALGARRKEAIVVTKVGLLINEDNVTIGRDSTPASVIANTERCLQRLGTDYIDLLLIHWPDFDTPIPETVGALEQLKADGKIRYYGVSNYDVDMMEVVLKNGHLTTNQVGYNIFDRRMEAAVLPYCLEHNIGFMSYGTLAFGLLTGAFTTSTIFDVNDWRSRSTRRKSFGLPLFNQENFLKELQVVERLKLLASDHGRSVVQLAIAWVLSHPAVTVALAGIRNRRELEENVAAVEWTLTQEIRDEIDRIMDEEEVSTFADAPQYLWKP
ncbi:MAG: aldo/keto reductase [Anaerolineales bacterium]|nr:aldo/keto reductase [Anaerolineales bacterium]